jgi:hypothetical protein
MSPQPSLEHEVVRAAAPVLEREQRHHAFECHLIADKRARKQPDPQAHAGAIEKTRATLLRPLREAFVDVIIMGMPDPCRRRRGVGQKRPDDTTIEGCTPLMKELRK